MHTIKELRAQTAAGATQAQYAMEALRAAHAHLTTATPLFAAAIADTSDSKAKAAYAALAQVGTAAAEVAAALEKAVDTLTAWARSL